MADVTDIVFEADLVTFEIRNDEPEWVLLHSDGRVTWTGDATPDEAATMFLEALTRQWPRMIDDAMREQANGL